MKKMVIAGIVASLGMGVAAHAESTHLKYQSHMYEVNGSGVEGTVLFHPAEGGGIKVTADISGNSGELPFSIHQGLCRYLDNDNGPDMLIFRKESIFEMDPVVGGASESVIDTDLETLFNYPHSFAIHNQDGEVISCGLVS